MSVIGIGTWTIQYFNVIVGSKIAIVRNDFIIKFDELI